MNSSSAGHSRNETQAMDVGRYDVLTAIEELW
jgi:hypothetical protein